MPKDREIYGKHKCRSKLRRSLFMEYLSVPYSIIDLGGYYDAYIATMKEHKDQTAYLKLRECLGKRMDEK